MLPFGLFSLYFDAIHRQQNPIRRQLLISMLVLLVNESNKWTAREKVEDDHPNLKHTSKRELRMELLKILTWSCFGDDGNFSSMSKSNWTRCLWMSFLYSRMVS